jgi:hypothetical protein
MQRQRQATHWNSEQLAAQRVVLLDCFTAHDSVLRVEERKMDSKGILLGANHKGLHASDGISHELVRFTLGAGEIVGVGMTLRIVTNTANLIIRLAGYLKSQTQCLTPTRQCVTLPA